MMKRHEEDTGTCWYVIRRDRPAGAPGTWCAWDMGRKLSVALDQRLVVVVSTEEANATVCVIIGEEGLSVMAGITS